MDQWNPSGCWRWHLKYLHINIVILLCVMSEISFTGDSNPSPNSYNLPNLIGPKIPTKRSSACFSMTGRAKTGGFSEDLAKTPGPGRYNTTDPSSYKRKAPNYSMLSRSFMPGGELNLVYMVNATATLQSQLLLCQNWNDIGKWMIINNFCLPFTRFHTEARSWSTLSWESNGHQKICTQCISWNSPQWICHSTYHRCDWLKMRNDYISSEGAQNSHISDLEVAHRTK